MKKNGKKIVALMGPTGVGKTPLAIELAQKCNAEIICVDSIAVYREFNIGVAKPSHAQREMALHHLIDIVDPIEPFSAGDFCRKAYEAISEIENREKSILLAGGSGLYFRAFFNGMFEIPERNLKIKESLEEKLRTNGIAYLYDELKGCDPETALAIHPNDSYRIVRGLEVYYTTGRKFSEYKTHFQNLKPARFEILKMGLNLPRPELHKRIALRTEKMLQEGLLDEVACLLDKYPATCKPFQSVGYKEAVSLSSRGQWPRDPDGDSSRLACSGMTDELKNQITQKTRALARRQLTWFRSEPGIRWFEPDESCKIEQTIKDFLAI